MSSASSASSATRLAVALAPLIAAAWLGTAGAAPSAATSAQSAPQAPSPAGPKASLKGEVLEALPGGGYTYLRLKTAGGEVWAAVAGAQVSRGQQVTIGQPAVMERFESKTLNRTFDRIVFGQLVDPKAPASMLAQAPPAAGMAGASPHGARPAAAPAAETKVAKVPKAEGPEARTVAEVVGGKAALKDKPVLVRAQVVKVNLGIMGKNWLHLRDGSGSAADGSHDILVTTLDKAAVGDIVNVRGTVRTDVTVGPGYSYPVLIEGAVLRK